MPTRDRLLSRKMGSRLGPMRPAAPRLLVNPGRRHDADAASPEVPSAQFHRRFPGYAASRLVDAADLAAELGLARLSVKDESHRFGLPSFKILGASSAVYRLLVARLGPQPERPDLDDLRTPLSP